MSLSIKDICENNYHDKIIEENGMECLCITSYLYSLKRILEKMERLPNGLYITTIRSMEANYFTGQKLVDSSTYLLWHDHLGHPGQDTMRRILKLLHRHPLSSKDLVYCNTICQACLFGKLMTRPSLAKITKEPILFLQRIQEEPPCKPFCYFMVLVDASTRWLHVCLLFTRKVAFAKFLTQLIS